jgi:hypothetical protein
LVADVIARSTLLRIIVRPARARVARRVMHFHVVTLFPELLHR